MTEILDGETVEDLQLGGLRIIQKKNGFRFGADAVLLSDFAARAKSRAILDLCTGSGIVPILLSAKTRAQKICGLEIQQEICDSARRSVELNGLNPRVEIICGDVKNAAAICGAGAFDTVTCNPPYMKSGAGLVNPSDEKAIARHEILCSLEDVIKVSAELLAPMRRFFMVHRPSRLTDIICAMREYKIEPKELRLVSPSAGKPPNLVLISGIRGGGKELRLLPELILFNADGSETEELKKIYNRS